jgi:hypothetical protein
MKYGLAVLLLCFVFSISHSKFLNNKRVEIIKTNNIVNRDTKENSSEKKDEPFYPQERVRSYSLNMAKYFTRFAKYSYCHTYLYSNNPVCNNIRSEWKEIYNSQYIKVLSSENNSVQKKIVFACSAPTILKALDENKLVYKFTDKSFDFKNSHFGAFSYFAEFYEEYVKDRIENNLLDIIKQNSKSKTENLQIFFIGHSYGAILCNLLALKASELDEYKKIKQKDSPVLITYGSPNIGGEYFARKTEELIPGVYRIVMRFDALPTYPRTIEDNEKIKEDAVKEPGPNNNMNFYYIPITNYGKHIVIDFNTLNENFCPKLPGSNAKCKVKAKYVSIHNRMYFKDNLSIISPKSEYNKSWFNAADIGKNAYAQSNK